jgi:hypothetical protein
MRTKARRSSNRSSKSLLLEPLESRLVMSALFAGASPVLAEPAVTLHLSAGSNAKGSASATIVTTIGNDTTVPAAAYSSISRSQLETRMFGQDIGYVSRLGSSVDYTLNVAVAGSYTLNVKVASANAAAFTVSDNGHKVASFTADTGGWDTITTVSSTVTLTAGIQRLRFSSANHTQYNLSGFELVLTPPAVVVTPPPSTTTTTTTSTTSTTTSTDPAPSDSSGEIIVSSSSSSPLLPTAASITQRTLTSFNELDVTGITSDASILVSESGNTFTITANGVPQQITGTFGDLMVYGGSGNATITVDSSVNIPTTIYSGAGNDALTNQTTAQATLVTLDGGADTLTGNGVNTAFWADARDTINSTATEQANGGVHVISSMYQPYTTTVGAAGFVTAVRDGSNLIDPTSSQSSTVTRLTSSSFWGTGPVITDINQGQASDCYFLTALQSLAQFEPGKLMQMGVDLGDGTYVVEFQRSGKISYVRVDGDLPSSGPYANGLLYEHPGASGDQWAAIFEKAYAYFRTGTNSYDSLDNGFPSSVYNDFGVADSLYMLPADQNAFYTTASAKLALNKPVDILTNSVVTNAPLIEAHTYTVLSVSKDASGTVWLTIRNPWGFDGVSWDSNPNDGVLVVDYAMIKANCIYGCLAT